MSNLFHILNGDHLASQLHGKDTFQRTIIFREALVVGPVTGNSLPEFWQIRAKFITNAYGMTAEGYAVKTIQEIEQLSHLPDQAEVCLWFEDDLFCQVNLWFILSLLAEKSDPRVFRVFPPEATSENRWKGFAEATPEDLELSYRAKVPFTRDDLALGKNLWGAYQQGDSGKLCALSKSESPCFRQLEEVCQAQADRLGENPTQRRPEKAILALFANGITDFDSVFSKFSEREGIYGFGDLQVKELFDYLVYTKQSLT